MMQALPPPTSQVEAVDVRPARLPPAASEGAFSVIRLDEKDLEGRQRLDQALSQAPGASLFRRTDSLSANPTTQGMSLRSIAPSGAGRALVILDGVPQNDPFGGWMIWAALPPELIENVALIRGGGAGPYGAGALTGTIDLSERSQPGLAADARYGERNTSRGTVVYETLVGGADLMFGASAGKTDGFVPVRAGRGAADTALAVEDWSVVLRGNFELADSTLSARVSAYDESRESGLVGAAARAQGQSGSLTLARAPSAGSFGYRLQGWVKASDLANSSVAVGAGRATTTPANNQYETPATGYGFNGALRGATQDHEWELGADMRFASGETREYFSYNAPLGDFTRDRRAGGDTVVAGTYAEGTLKRGDLLFTGGVRVDYWSSENAIRLERTRATGAVLVNATAPDRDGWLPTARGGIRRNFGANYVRTAAYAGFRAPTLNELHRPFRVGNDITEANPELEPEKLYGVEAAFGRDDGKSGYNVTLFYNELNDAVTNVTVGLPPPGGGVIPSFPNAGFIPANGVLRQRQNAGVIEAVGLEADAWRQWTPSFTTRIAASHTVAKVNGGLAAPQLTGLRPAQAPRLTMTASAEWAPIDRLNLSARARYEGVRYDDDLNTRELSAAGVVDLRAAYEIQKGLQIYIAGDNVFDADVQTATTADGVFSYAQPATVSIGLTLRR